MKIPLLYALHCGGLYGTERMALDTALGLSDRFEATVFAPPGAALAEAERLGLGSRPFSNSVEFATALRPFLARHARVAFLATGVTHSLVFLLLNRYYGRRASHLHVVHGGADERQSYGRKKVLNGFGVTFVSVSGFVRSRLIAHGVKAQHIRVVENFLYRDASCSEPDRPRTDRNGIRKVVVVSRVDSIKRVDLLLDALDAHPELESISFRILGSGRDLEALRQRASLNHPNVTFVGFSQDVAGELRKSDLLLHLCPVEPFGLSIIEAMAAGTPVLVPDAGGAGSLVEEGVSGFKFEANDPDSLARHLGDLSRFPVKVLNAVVAGGLCALETRFSASARLEDYARLLKEELP